MSTLYEKSIQEILHELELFHISATASCEAQIILPDIDYPIIFRVSEFRYAVMQVQETINNVLMEIEHMEQDVEEHYQDAHHVRLQYKENLK